MMLPDRFIDHGTPAGQIIEAGLRRQGHRRHRAATRWARASSVAADRGGPAPMSLSRRALALASARRRRGRSDARDARPTRDAAAPIQALNQALLAAMKAGKATPFAQRYAALAPVGRAGVRPAGDPAGVGRAALGLAAAGRPAAAARRVPQVHRRPATSRTSTNTAASGSRSCRSRRTIGADQVVGDPDRASGGDPTPIDYVMRRSADGWRAVDVLLNGSISQVAVNRSDWRSLLASGAGPLIDSLQRRRSPTCPAARSTETTRRADRPVRRSAAPALAGAGIAAVGVGLRPAAAQFRAQSGARARRMAGRSRCSSRCTATRPLLEEALASFCAQDYPAFQIVFGVQDPADPALAVVDRLRARFPHVDIDVVIDPTRHGSNRKIGNLINMFPARPARRAGDRRQRHPCAAGLPATASRPRLARAGRRPGDDALHRAAGDARRAGRRAGRRARSTTASCPARCWPAPWGGRTAWARPWRCARDTLERDRRPRRRWRTIWPTTPCSASWCATGA